VRLVPGTLRDLEALHWQWQTVTGAPTAWVPVSHDLFALYPHPATGGGRVRVDYIAWPSALQDDGDSPEDVVADHELLVTYARYEGLLHRWQAERALQHWGDFQRGGRRMQGRAVRRSDHRLWQQAPMDRLGHASEVE